MQAEINKQRSAARELSFYGHMAMLFFPNFLPVLAFFSFIIILLFCYLSDMLLQASLD